MKLILIALMLTNIACASTWHGKIYNVKTQTEVSQEEYIQALSRFSHIVLGEKHYTEAVQEVQAKTISLVVQNTGKTNSFTTAWEFLNVTAQKETERLFEQVKKKELTAQDFVKQTQGKNDSAAGYAAIIETTAQLGGNVLGMNLSRAEKKPVTERGIEALDPKLLPPGFAHGTKGYYERFVEQMQGHATPEQIKNYYDSQCLVDDIMAYHLLNSSAHDLNFLIAGSFHTDYYDGAVHRLIVRRPDIEIVTVKIIDASDYEESELLPQMHSQQYGDIADYVYFVNNPK